MNAAKTFFPLMVLTGLLLLIGAGIGGERGVIIAVFFVIFMNFYAGTARASISRTPGNSYALASLFSTHLHIARCVRRLGEMPPNY